MKLGINNLFIILKSTAISLILLSCGGKTGEKALFPEEKEIVFSDMAVGDSLGQVLLIKSTDDYIVVAEKSVNTQLQLIDRKTKESYRFGRTGQGPGELLAGFDIMLKDNKHIAVFDVQKRTLFDFNTDSVVKLRESARPEILIREVPLFPLSMACLDEQTYILLGLMNGLKRFTLIDGNGEVISTEGDLPAKTMEQVSDFVHAFAYWGRVTANRKEGKAAICTNYAGIMQIYGCKTGAVQLIREHSLFLADYTEVDGNLAANSQTRWGYLSIDSNDRFIFALYSGLNQTENPDGAFMASGVIHVFDWEGNPVCRLVSDRKLQTICVDSNFNLYGYDTEKGDIAVASVKDIFAQR